MNELLNNLETMEKLYQEKIKQVESNTEFQYISGKLEFIQHLRHILWTSENMERFVESMAIKESSNAR